MNFFQKLMDSIKQGFSSFSNGFSNMFANFSLASLFGVGSAQAAVPPQPPARAAVVAQQPAVRAPVVAPTAQPSVTPKAQPTVAEQRAGFEQGLSPEQRALYTKHAELSKAEANNPATAGGTKLATPAAIAHADFQASLNPQQQENYRTLQQAEQKAKFGDLQMQKVSPTGVITRISETGITETITPANPALGDRGVARVDLTRPEPSPVVAAAPVVAQPEERMMRAPRPQPQNTYTEQGPNGSSVRVNPAQYENNRPYMGENGANRGGFQLPQMRQPFVQETAERAAFNPHNVNSVQNRFMNVLGGQVAARMGNSIFAPIAEGVVRAAAYDMGRQGPPNIGGNFAQAATHNGTYGNGAYGVQTDRQATMQGIIQDGINTSMTRAVESVIPQHSHPGGAFGALLGKLGR